MFFDIEDLRTNEIFLRLTKTCEISGGELLEITNIPKDNEMYLKGKRQVKIFKFKI